MRPGPAPVLRLPAAVAQAPARTGAWARSARDLVEQTGRSCAEFSAPALAGLQRLPAAGSHAVFAVCEAARDTLIQQGRTLETGAAALLGTAEVAAMVAGIVTCVWPLYRAAALVGVVFPRLADPVSPAQEQAASEIAAASTLLLMFLLRDAVFGDRDVVQIGREHAARAFAAPPIGELERSTVLALLA